MTESEDETSAWRAGRSRRADLCDRGARSVFLHAVTASGPDQHGARRPRHTQPALRLPRRCPEIPGAGTPRPDAALSRAGAPRLPETGNRPKDRWPGATRLCAELCWGIAKAF